MAKDSLARGAKSAVFVGGTPQRDEPIEFHGTVAAETSAQTCVHGLPFDRACVLCDQELAEVQARPVPKSLDELAALYEPMNGRVLLRRVTEENKRLIALPDAFKLESDLGIVISGPLPLKRGDKVRVGHYNIEEIEVEGETLMLVDRHDIRLRIKA